MAEKKLKDEKMKDWGEIVQDYNVDRASSRAGASEEATLHQVSTFTATSIHILANNPQPFVTIVYFDNDTVNFTRTFFSEKSLLSAVTFILWGVNAWIKLQSTINLGLRLSELLKILSIKLSGLSFDYTIYKHNKILYRCSSYQ